MRGRKLLSEEDAAFIDNYAAEIERISSGLLDYKPGSKKPEHERLKSEFFEMQKRLEKIRSKIMSSSPLSVKEATELVERQVEFSKYRESTVKKHLIELARFTGGMGFDEGFYVLEIKGRAGASSAPRGIKVPPRRKREVFHEVGHHIEYQHPEIGEAARAWTRQRSTGETRRLRDLTRDYRYGYDEMALVGKFIDPYVGKLNPDSRHTEVVSIGLERMYKGEAMGDLAMDSDHFFFTLGVLRR